MNRQILRRKFMALWTTCLCSKILPWLWINVKGGWLGDHRCSKEQILPLFHLMTAIKKEENMPITLLFGIHAILTSILSVQGQDDVKLIIVHSKLQDCRGYFHGLMIRLWNAQQYGMDGLTFSWTIVRRRLKARVSFFLPTTCLLVPLSLFAVQPKVEERPSKWQKHLFQSKALHLDSTRCKRGSYAII
jgi:hypothetical protein